MGLTAVLDESIWNIAKGGKQGENGRDEKAQNTE